MRLSTSQVSIRTESIRAAEHAANRKSLHRVVLTRPTNEGVVP